MKVVLIEKTPHNITGAELLAALQKATPKQLALPVVMEGCDCVNPCGEVEISLPDKKHTGQVWLGIVSYE